MKPVYLKAKIKSYNGKINANFHNNLIPKEGFYFICLSVILFDSAFRIGNPQVLLEECKYVLKEKMLPEYITDDIEIYSDSDEEICNEENSNEEN